MDDNCDSLIRHLKFLVFGNENVPDFAPVVELVQFLSRKYNTSIGDLVNKIVTGVKDINHIIIEYAAIEISIHDSGHQVPFDIPINSTITYRYTTLGWSDMFLSKTRDVYGYISTGFQMPSHESLQWDYETESSQVQESSDWQWVKIMSGRGRHHGGYQQVFTKMYMHQETK